MTERAPSFSPKSTDHLADTTTAEQRSLSKWYTAARAALARNRPLTTDAPEDTRSTTDLSAAETEALHSVGAFKDKASVRAENDPLIKSQTQYMALLEDSLSATEAAKLLRVDVSRVRQRLRERSLFGIEYEALAAFPVRTPPRDSGTRASLEITPARPVPIGHCRLVRTHRSRSTAGHRRRSFEPARMVVVEPPYRTRHNART
jgi:hypothetical protein